ncbi:hypothetical protein Tco_0845475 [Tanacetum coccineum]
MTHEDGDNDAIGGNDDERTIIEEDDGEWICFLGGNTSSGTKKYRGSNSNDGGNTGDRVKIAGGVIGSGDEIFDLDLFKLAIGLQKANQIQDFGPTEPIAQEPSTLVLNTHSDKQIQKEVAQLNGNTFMNLFGTPEYEEVVSSSNY